MRSLVSLIIVAIIIAYLITKQNNEKTRVVTKDEITHEIKLPRKAPRKVNPASPAATMTPPTAPSIKQAPKLSVAAADATSSNVQHFKMEDGVAVVQGDMVVGEIAGGPSQGNVLLPKIYPWKRNEITFAVSAELPRPERIQQAVEMFNETAVQLVPYTGSEEDMIVFIPGTGNCKSYVGRVRGKQPIWIAPECEANDVAHEIMHALGFIHEQNRTDRDSYVEVLDANVKEEFKFNFAKLPEDFMQLSGLSDFDYNSIMMYPDTAFSKDGSATIVSKNSSNKIAPKPTLSNRDIERINKEYGNK